MDPNILKIKSGRDPSVTENKNYSDDKSFESDKVGCDCQGDLKALKRKLFIKQAILARKIAIARLDCHKKS